MGEALRVVGAEQRIRKGIRETFRNTTNSVVSLWEGVEMLEFLLEKLERNVPKVDREPYGRSERCAGVSLQQR